MDSQDEPGASTTDEEARLARIERELEAVKGTKFAEPEEPEQAAQLAAIEQRAKLAKETLRRHTAEGQVGGFVGPEGGRSLGKGLQIAYAIIGVPIVGFGVGWLIDKQVGGNLWQGLMTILGATIAVIYAVRSASRD